MKTLKDVYIKVTKQNKDELYTLLNRKIRIGYFLYFLSDDIKTSWLTPDIQLNKQKVSLSELKRLIETIPTRDEITRLKRQISWYKTNLSLTNERCKELQSDNNILNSNLVIKENLISSLNNDIKKYDSLFIQKNEEIKQLDFYKKRSEAMTKQRQYIYKLYEDLYLENQELSKMYDDLKENKRLKNKKWYQIWK